MTLPPQGNGPAEKPDRALLHPQVHEAAQHLSKATAEVGANLVGLAMMIDKIGEMVDNLQQRVASLESRL